GHQRRQHHHGAQQEDGPLDPAQVTGLCRRDLAQRRSSFGSSASRNPSPSRLKARTVKKIASAGKIAACGAVSISERAASSMAPHSGVGGCAPMPRNDRLAAVMIEVPMRSEKYTMTADTVPGKMCPHTILESDAPRSPAPSSKV